MFKNWGKLNRTIFILGSIFILASSLLSGKLGLLSLVTLIGTLLGFLSVALIVNQKKQAGLVGLLSAIYYIIVSFFAKNPSDMILNICFIIVLDFTKFCSSCVMEYYIPIRGCDYYYGNHVSILLA